ncbi:MULTISPECIES: LacI family DNA-binding transcriptional regulator [unclassified Brachybacterium]|uniref:LacI family DNA-binding transcriptional regulator n=1 Tax=unclassified Brachybacterium TaxID=2623841 RepID=UPI00402AD0FF
MSKPTIKDIAAEAGVALGTASRALSGNGSVAPETRERVLAAAERLNYIPNALARSLRSERSETIGLLIPDVRNPFFAELAHVVEREARSLGLSVVLCSANEDPALMRDYTLVLRRQQVDGIIVAPFSTARDTLLAVQDAGMPLVFVDRTIPGMGVPAVVSDTGPAISDAVAQLAVGGAQRLGFLSGPSQTTTGVERLAEFIAAAKATGIDTVIQHGDFQEESGRRGMRDLLEAGVDSVLTADSRMTLGAVRECLETGIVPVRDLPFIGFDDISPFALLQPPLPLICQDLEGMATTAVQLIQAQLRGESPHTEHRLPAQLRIPAALTVHTAQTAPTIPEAEDPAHD